MKIKFRVKLLPTLDCKQYKWGFLASKPSRSCFIGSHSRCPKCRSTYSNTHVQVPPQAVPRPSDGYTYIDNKHTNCLYTSLVMEVPNITSQVQDGCYCSTFDSHLDRMSPSLGLLRSRDAYRYSLILVMCCQSLSAIHSHPVPSGQARMNRG